MQSIPQFTQCQYAHFALWHLKSHLDTQTFHKSQKLVTTVSLVTFVIVFIAITVIINVYMVNITFQYSIWSAEVTLFLLGWVFKF
jgi:hypothetical protein